MRRENKNLNIKEIISNLISEKREGVYWDFKLEWHKNNVDLLHDIICLANAKHDGDRYLIIGVADPPDSDIVGVDNDSNRKKQSDLIDFLSNQPFCAETRPSIIIETLNFESKRVDVIVIKNEPLKPFMLSKIKKENGKTLHPGTVYTRIGDKNTAKDKTADIYHVEQMWRERFGLDLSPLDRFRKYLQDFRNWEWDGINSAYYSPFPEFTIKQTSSVKREENGVWWDSWGGDKPLLEYTYELRYHTTLLEEILALQCYREDFSFPYPDVSYIPINNSEYHDADNTYSYFYYIKNSLEYSMLFHLFKGKVERIQSQTKPPISYLPFMIFESENEKDKYINKLRENITEFFSAHSGFPRKKLGEEMQQEEREFAYWAYTDSLFEV